MIKALRDAYAPILESILKKCRRREGISPVGRRYSLAAEWTEPVIELHKKLSEATEPVEVGDEDKMSAALGGIAYWDVPLTKDEGRVIIAPWQFAEMMAATAQDAFNNYIWARAFDTREMTPTAFDFELEFKGGKAESRVHEVMLSAKLDRLPSFMRRADFVGVRIVAATPEAPTVYEARGSTGIYRRHHWMAAKADGAKQLRADVIADAISRGCLT